MKMKDDARDMRDPIKLGKKLLELHGQSRYNMAKLSETYDRSNGHLNVSRYKN